MISKSYARILFLLLSSLLFMLLACTEQEAAGYGIIAPMPDEEGACHWSTAFCSNEQLMDQIDRDFAKNYNP